MKLRLLIWINAFIPRDVPGYTETIAVGAHAGKTAVPLPGPARLNPMKVRSEEMRHLTDQRTFSNSPTCERATRSLAEMDFDTKLKSATALRPSLGHPARRKSTLALACRRISPKAVSRVAEVAANDAGPAVIERRGVLVPSQGWRRSTPVSGGADQRMGNQRCRAGGRPFGLPAADIDYQGALRFGGFLFRRHVLR